jgi:hypothetical protein
VPAKRLRARPLRARWVLDLTRELPTGLYEGKAPGAPTLRGPGSAPGWAPPRSRQVPAGPPRPLPAFMTIERDHPEEVTHTTEPERKGSAPRP